MLIRALILFLPLFANTAYTQADVINLYENDSFELCGSYVTVDGIWINEGIIMADISTQDAINSKPITGGYKKGDEFSVKECVFYVHSVTKSGFEGKGVVVLGKEIPITPPPQDCDRELIFIRSRPYKIDTLDWKIARIYRTTEDSLNAEINISYTGSYITTLNLKPGAVLWTGECAYSLEKTEGSDSLVFKKLNEFFYSSRSGIPEEYLPESRTELIIRKMKVFKKMFPSEEDIKKTKEKIWLLRIFFYPGGMIRPVIKVERDGKVRAVEYETVRTFKTKKEACEYAKDNGISDIKIEE